MVAVIAATAFVGAGSASANIKELTLCKANEKLCKKANIAKEVHAIAKNARLLGTLDQECGTSLVIAKELGLATATRITATVTELTFLDCEPCTEITTAPPYAATVENMTMTSGGGAILEGCPFGIDCEFGSSSIALDIELNANGSIAGVNADKEPLSLKSGSKFFCGSTGEWDALYVPLEELWLVPEREP
jgi:hypothetical protein